MPLDEKGAGEDNYCLMHIRITPVGGLIPLLNRSGPAEYDNGSCLDRYGASDRKRMIGSESFVRKRWCM